MQLLDAYARAGRPRPLVMVQWEIAQVLWEEHGVRADVSATVDAEGNYLSTYGVMAQEPMSVSGGQLLFKRGRKVVKKWSRTFCNLWCPRLYTYLEKMIHAISII